MECPSLTSLGDLAANAVDPAARAELEAHLSRCEACRAAMVALLSRTARSPSSPKAAALGRGATVGRYVVLELVGEGAMGRVYGAWDPVLDRRVALKIIHPLREGAAMQARLLREAQAMARMAHPNLVAVHDAGEHAGSVFIAMEFVEGATLRAWLAKEPRTPGAVLEAFAQAGRGLAAAHAAGIVHRDFKPENVLVGEDGRVRVSDFGLARDFATGGESGGEEGSRLPAPGSRRSAEEGTAIRRGENRPIIPSPRARGEGQGEGSGEAGSATGPPQDPAPLTPALSPPPQGEGALSDLTHTRGLVGTPAYMAPEQLAARPADARADQFAFCVAIFEALTGARPFEANSAELVATRREALRSPALPPRVARALERGLRADPAERFPDLPSLLQALAEPPRRSAARLAAALAGAALLAALAVGWVIATQRPEALCASGDERLAAVWDARRQSHVGAHLASLPNGAPVWQRLKATLDGWGRAWVATHREACEATRLRGEQSDQALAARMACLDRRLLELDALTSVLATTDADGLPGASEAVAALTPLSVCANVGALLAPQPLPENPAAAARVAEVQRSLATARALLEAGRFREGLPMATTAALTAHGLGFAPTEAEALLLRGELQEAQSEHAAAEPTLRDAYAIATAARDDRTAVRAAVWLSFVVGERLSRLKEGSEWAWHAGAALKRVGPDWELEAKLANQEGHLLFDAADFPGAEAKYRHAWELRKQNQGEAHASTASMLANVGRALNAQARYDEGLAVARESTRMLEAALGKGHPKALSAHNNIASVLLNLGRNDEALAEVESVIPDAEAALGPEHAEVARLLLSRAEALERLGRAPEAIPYDERAVRIFEAAKMEFMVAEALINLGEALGQTERVDEAVAQLARAREVLGRVVGDGHENVSVAYEIEGNTLLDHHQPARALTAFREALKRREAAHGVDFTENAYSLRGVGQALVDLGRGPEAVEPLEHAKRLLEADPINDELLEETKNALAAAHRPVAAK